MSNPQLCNNSNQNQNSDNKNVVYAYSGNLDKQNNCSDSISTNTNNNSNSSQETSVNESTNSIDEDTNFSQNKPNNNSKIKELIKCFNDTFEEYKLFLIQFESYQKLSKENNFSVFERKKSIFLNIGTEKVTQNSKDDLKRLNHLFITHEYQTIPTIYNMQYLANQVAFYIGNPYASIARFHGFCMTDSENRFVPTVLTERPIKGPLSSSSLLSL